MESSKRILRTIIVDDEMLSVNLIRSILSKVPEVEIIAECFNGREAITKTQELLPDLLFLDIQMPGVNGFQVVQALQSDIMPMIVFATAFDKYAFEAFDVHAVDYVLKPFDVERVHRAIERVLARADTDGGEGGARKMPLIGAISDITKKVCGEDFPSSSARPAGDLSEAMQEKLAIRDGGAVTLVPFSDIEWIDAAGDYMCVHANGETHIVRSTLKDLLERLDGNRFKRIHRSTIVNIESIAEITPLPKGERLLRLTSDYTLKVSRTYRTELNGLIK